MKKSLRCKTFEKKPLRTSLVSPLLCDLLEAHQFLDLPAALPALLGVMNHDQKPINLVGVLKKRRWDQT